MRNLRFFKNNRLIFNIFYCFHMFMSKHFTQLGRTISKSKRYDNVIPWVHYFYVKAKILTDFRSALVYL